MEIGILINCLMKIYRCAQDTRAKVNDYMKRSDNVVVWMPIVRRNLLQSEESSLLPLLQMVGKLFISEHGIDYRSWAPSRDGTFFVSSFAEVLQQLF